MLRVKLYWLRETGCDAGTVLGADQLEPAIRDAVVRLAGSDQEIELRLPFFDKPEWRRRGEILSALVLARRGGVISCVLPPHSAVRDLAATLAHSHPAWSATPPENDLQYFPVWQSVSVALQETLRKWITAEYFCDVSRYQDREAAFPMLVYGVSRIFKGRPRSDFTYDVRDYPDCSRTLALAWRMVGLSLQAVMEQIERKLSQAGMPVLARRYAPIWSQDVLVAVRNKPRRFAELLAGESMVINAVIDLGTDRSVAGVNRCARNINQALRDVHGMDLRRLGVPVLEEATSQVAQALACDALRLKPELR